MRRLFDAGYVRELELRLRRVQRSAAANRRLALTDRLTGLPNRRHLELHLDRVLVDGALRPLSLVLFDVDDFKGFNDRHGYPAGDRVLAAVATVFARASANASRRLESCGFPSRPESCHRPAGCAGSACDSPFVARLGGDEFVVIFGHMSAGRVRSAADRLARTVARHPRSVSVSPHCIAGRTPWRRRTGISAAGARQPDRSRRTGAFGTFGRKCSACTGFPARRGAPTPRRAPSALRHERNPSDAHRSG